MLLRHSCPLINQNESLFADSLGQSHGVVIIVSGRRHSGKDWLGNIIKAQFGNLLGEQGKSLVKLVSISEGTKLAYAKEVGLNGDLLLRSRKYKEQHRVGLSQFYKRKKLLDTAFDRKCFVEVVQKYSNGGILIVTGMRDGADYVKL
jgi:phosphomevalonate kinase